MKKRRLIKFIAGFVSVLIILFGVYLYLAIKNPKIDLAPSLTQPSLPQAREVSITWPNYGESAIGSPGFGVLSTHNDQKPMPTASVAKIVTALAVLKQHPLAVGEKGPLITISAEDVSNYQKFLAADGSVVPVKEGEQISEYEALQALLLPSANNMADLLARWSFGSVENYTTFANNFVQSLGLKQTHIADPSGFNPLTTSTASDLVLIGENAIDDPLLASIVDSADATVPVAGIIMNVNKLLGHNEVIGIKTGNTDQAGGVFLFATNHVIDASNSIKLVGVVMGAPNLRTALQDSLTVINSSNSGFVIQKLLSADTVVGSYAVPWSHTIPIYSQKDVSISTWASKAPLVKYTAGNLNYQSAGTVGEVNVQSGRDVTTSHLIIKEAVPAPSLKWRISHIFN
ncbi:MAG: hypothetical protein NVSMB46_01630 [Candidatus Saccharimonadales bacterium]